MTNYYTHRLNRVLDYVSDNLSGDLSLDKLAAIAHFSRYHFHRIFHGQMGETVNAFVRRQRLERAAQLMRAAPQRTLTEVAFQVGFSSSTDFSRRFKDHYGFPPSQWDRDSPMPESKIGQDHGQFGHYSPQELEERAGEFEFEVRVERWPETRYTYFRVHNSYDNEIWMATYERLFDFLGKRGLDHSEVVLVGMSPDDPEITPREQCRYDIGVIGVVKSGPDTGLLGRVARERGVSDRLLEQAAALNPTALERETLGVATRSLPRGEVASLRCQGELAKFHFAWGYLFACWLPESRYQPADAPAMEVFRKLPQEIGWETFDVEGACPIQPMGLGQ